MVIWGSTYLLLPKAVKGIGTIQKNELLIVATSMRTFFLAKKEAERWICKISGSSRIYLDPNIAFHLFFFWCLKNLTLKESKMYAVSKNSTNHSKIDMLILNHLLVDSCLQFITKGCY